MNTHAILFPEPTQKRQTAGAIFSERHPRADDHFLSVMFFEQRVAEEVFGQRRCCFAVEHEDVHAFNPLILQKAYLFREGGQKDRFRCRFSGMPRRHPEGQNDAFGFERAGASDNFAQEGLMTPMHAVKSAKRDDRFTHERAPAAEQWE